MLLLLIKRAKSVSLQISGRLEKSSVGDFFVTSTSIYSHSAEDVIHMLASNILFTLQSVT